MALVSNLRPKFDPRSWLQLVPSPHHARKELLYNLDPSPNGSEKANMKEVNHLRQNWAIFTKAMMWVSQKVWNGWAGDFFFTT
jgi:hypothetical protein